MKAHSTTALLFAVFAILTFAPPLWPQQNTYAITGEAYNYPTNLAMGSRASGGPFSYQDHRGDISNWMGYCTIGQPCTLDVRIYYQSLDYIPFKFHLYSTLGDLSTPYVRADVHILLPTFVTPAPPPGQEGWYSIQLPGRVKGTVSALYYDPSSHTEWELWTAALEGKGTTEVRLWNDYQSEVIIGDVHVPYSGTATVVQKGRWIKAPTPALSGIAYGRQSLFVSDLSVDGLTTITQIEPRKGDVLRSFLSPSETGFDGRGNPSDLTYARDHLFISDVGTAGAGRVFEIAPDATKIYNTFPLPFRGGAIATDGIRLFVGDLDSGNMVVLGGREQSRRTFANGLRPAGMVFDRTNNVLWVIDQIKMGVISQVTTRGELLRTCQGPWSIGNRGLGGVALSGNTLWIAEISGFVYYYDPYAPGTISLANSNNLVCSPTLPITVRVDIKPWLASNTIDPHSTETVPVAILGTAQFNPATINPATLTFGDTGREARPAQWQLVDVNNDGRVDLLARFNARTAGLVCGVSLASVSGRTFTGKEFRGTDAIAVLGCN